MIKDSNIKWTGHTADLWRGCTKAQAEGYGKLNSRCENYNPFPVLKNNLITKKYKL